MSWKICYRDDEFVAKYILIAGTCVAENQVNQYSTDAEPVYPHLP